MREEKESKDDDKVEETNAAGLPAADKATVSNAAGIPAADKATVSNAAGMRQHLDGKSEPGGPPDPGTAAQTVVKTQCALIYLQQLRFILCCDGSPVISVVDV